MCKERDLSPFCFYLISLFLILICPLFLCWPLHVYNFHARKKQGSIAKELAGMATPLKFLGLLFLQFSDDFWPCWLGILAVTASIYMKGPIRGKLIESMAGKEGWGRWIASPWTKLHLIFEVFVCCCSSIKAYICLFFGCCFFSDIAWRICIKEAFLLCSYIQTQRNWRFFILLELLWHS